MTGLQRGFVVLPRRWVVERTSAWLVHHRRLARDHERRHESHEDTPGAGVTDGYDAATAVKVARVISTCDNASHAADSSPANRLRRRARAPIMSVLKPQVKSLAEFSTSTGWPAALSYLCDQRQGL
jgi:hypothetical protein